MKAMQIRYRELRRAIDEGNSNLKVIEPILRLGDNYFIVLNESNDGNRRNLYATLKEREFEELKILRKLKNEAYNN